MTPLFSNALSLPARGAWIETADLEPGQYQPGSLPARGAWIETRC
ncbi:Uncharacterized protein dnm_098800 [Desulfonema magnum]|uniref:Uncharacterized protein n=1 Tax=Desulfonema magnum TaxID=45655 RepID=A0A975BZ11_9BACT|nr:Uncharacterized protein dnm_098800 [Desulfonema magnum]